MDVARKARGVPSMGIRIGISRSSSDLVVVRSPYWLILRILEIFAVSLAIYSTAILEYVKSQPKAVIY